MQDIRPKLAPARPLLKYLAAVAIGAFIWGVQSFWVSGSDITPFTLAILGVGVTLAFGTIVESYQVAACRDGAIMLDRVMADVVFSVSVMVPVTLVLWSGADASQQHMFGLICGVIVMTLLLQRNPRARPTHAVIAQYQHDPKYFSLHIWFPRILPPIYCALWIGSATHAPLSAWSETNLLHQVVLLPIVVHRLHPHRGLGIASPSVPATVGVCLVALVLLTAFTGYLPAGHA